MGKQKIEKIPRHVAIIMDGNRRWAKKRGLPAIMGHRKVVEEVLEKLIERAGELGISYITFWAWSSENWKRDKREVGAIMKLFRFAIKRYAKRLIKKGARVRTIGDLDGLPKDIAEAIREVVEESKKNKKITVTFAVNYGGRDELLRAIRKIYDSRFKIQDLDEERFSELLDTAGMPDPDLIIRTSGEQRLSGFLPWQSAYSELYFPKALMPDFGVAEFDKAMREYQQRKRRYGK